VVGTYDGAHRVVYIDGLPVLTMEDTGAISIPAESVCIGGRSKDSGSNNPDGFYTGLMDDVRIYKGAISAETVQALWYDATGQALCPVHPVGDISGPNGVPDCIVDFWDLDAVIDGTWLGCGRLPASECPN